MVRCGQWHLTSGINDRLDSAINLGKRHLKGNLDGVESELGSLPLLKALEHERNSADVGLVEPFKHLGSLLVVLRSWSSNEGESCEVDYGVNDGLASRVVKVFL